MLDEHVTEYAKTLQLMPDSLAACLLSPGFQGLFN